VQVAEEAGLRATRPIVLRDATNLLVHLSPAPVVARVATATGTVRKGGAWLARELAVAGHLARVGAPVVPPSAELPAGPHHRDGLVLSFWEHVQEIDAPLDGTRAGRALRPCHDALADFDGELPRLAVLDEAQRIVERLAASGSVHEEDASLVRRRAGRLREAVERFGLAEQAIHGDAHLGNVIATAAGPLWNDWEDTFQGPILWDLGCLHASAPPFGHRDPRLIAAVHAAYGGDHDRSSLEVFVEARRFQVATWGLLLGITRRDSEQTRQYLTWLRASATRA
jgi:thiamine kinase-like enzyme